MKRENLINFRITESEKKMIEQMKEILVDGTETELNRSDVIRFAIKQLYQDFINEGRIESKDVVGGGFYFIV